MLKRLLNRNKNNKAIWVLYSAFSFYMVGNVFFILSIIFDTGVGVTLFELIYVSFYFLSLVYVVVYYFRDKGVVE